MNGPSAHRSVLLALVLCLVLVMTACGGNASGNGTDPTTEPTDGATGTLDPTQSAEPQGEAVGKVGEILDNLTQVAGRRAANGDPLFRGSELTTDDQGSATFEVRPVLEDCQVQTSSTVIVAPARLVTLDVRAGSIICRTKPGTDDVEIRAGDATVEFRDPILLVEVSGGRTTLRVDQGFVQLKSRSGPAVLVGPRSSSSASAGRNPPAPQIFQASTLDPANSAALRRLRAGLPDISPDPPAPGSSRALGRLAQTRQLRVGVDDTGSESELGFAERLFRSVAERWEMQAETDFFSNREGSAKLAQQELEAFISPDAVSGAARIPLFREPRGRPWSLWVRPDRRFQSELQDLFVSILNDGPYADAYIATYAAVPRYDDLLPLVYPTGGQFDASQWVEPVSPSPTPDEGPSPTPDGIASPTDQGLGGGSVESISIAINPGNSYKGKCPHLLTFVGTVQVTEPGKIGYQWFKQNQPLADGVLDAGKPGEYVVDLDWLVGVSETQKVRLEVPSQNVSSPEAVYEVACA